MRNPVFRLSLLPLLATHILAAPPQSDFVPPGPDGSCIGPNKINVVWQGDDFASGVPAKWSQMTGGDGRYVRMSGSLILPR